MYSFHSRFSQAWTLDIAFLGTIVFDVHIFLASKKKRGGTNVLLPYFLRKVKVVFNAFVVTGQNRHFLAMR